MLLLNSSMGKVSWASRTLQGTDPSAQQVLDVYPYTLHFKVPPKLPGMLNPS